MDEPGPSTAMALEFVDLKNVPIERVHEQEGDQFDDEDQELGLIPLQNLPANHLSLLILNDSIKNRLWEFRKTLIERLNRERQAELEAASLGIVCLPKEIPVSSDAAGPANSSNLTAFRSPYFRDVRDFHPPPNNDVILRKERGFTNQALIDEPKPFTRSEIDRLKILVRQYGMKQRLEPYVRKQESLIEEMDVMENCGISYAYDRKVAKEKRADIAR